MRGNAIAKHKAWRYLRGSVAAGCRGFLAIGDWLRAYHCELVELFAPAKERLPSYSTVRQVLLNVGYCQYESVSGAIFSD